MESPPLSSVGKGSPSRRKLLSSFMPFAGKDASPTRDILSFSTRLKPRKGEKKDNNTTRRKKRISARMTLSSKSTRNSITDKKSTHSEIDSTELPNFSNLSPIKKPQRPRKFIVDHPDISFQTQETVSESDSDQSQDEDLGSCVRIMNNSDEERCPGATSQDTEDSYTRSNSPLSTCSKQSPGVRFADEVGLPIQSIMHYECDRKQREHSELLVLCIYPERKTFEFLQVGYFQGGDASVEDLLVGIPGMCTNPVFCQSKFVSLYRKNGLGFVDLCSQQSTTEIDGNNNCKLSCLLLQDCGFKENEVLIAAIEGSSERAVLQGIGPILGNKKIRKTLKRARQSRRGLKFIRRKQEVFHNDKDSQYHLQKRFDLVLRRRKLTDEGTEKIGDIPNIETDCVDEFRRDCDPLSDVSEYRRQLLLCMLAIGSGTVVFSALGL